MVATPTSKARTRAFARVIGPFLVLAPGIVAVRAPGLGAVLASFFQNPALVWVVGAFLLIGGLLIIAHHHYWSGLAAILISLLGWLLALRGVALLAAPELIARPAAAALTLVPLVRIGFAALVAAGLWLTYVGWLAKPSREEPEDD